MNAFGSSFQVLEGRTVIPKFSNFCMTSAGKTSASYLNAAIKERIPRYVKWIDQCFIVDDKQLRKWEQQDSLTLHFKNVTNALPLTLMVRLHLYLH